ncbi:MAG: ABC transporter permease [Gammaproteobacteria bacterium]|nr:ABC transporter permease [Gammaproteobacteria bacterium]MCF6338920.1 ABC transporter permease [Gammaproteobacteria bacterium]
MKTRDATRFAFDALRGYRTRTLLMLLAMSIGVASVLVLTSLGEAARRYVTGEFSSLGTNLIIVLPGKSETSGGSPSLLGGTTRDLTLNDALAVSRSALINHMAPLIIGSAPVSVKNLQRDVMVVGSTSSLLDVRQWRLGKGRFLPETDITRARFVTVLGSTLKQELFGAKNALGEWVRIGDRRFRVIGIMAAQGRSFDIDVENVAFVPVAAAQMLFNTQSLFRILLDTRSRESIPRAIAFIKHTLRERHQGEEDVTLITQDAVLATFDKILRALTLTVAGIAAISLAVAGILIMNVMLVAVSQRTTEIGLLKALGVPQRQIIRLFMTEAALLSGMGAGLGLLVGQTVSSVIGYFYPALPLGTPWWAFLAAIGVALGTGLLFSLLPARRAAQLDPVQALARR